MHLKRLKEAGADHLRDCAPAGSGKTKTLTTRVAYLLRNNGYEPQNVIVATFTVKAAREMRDRLETMLGDGSEKRLILGTFHSVSRRFLVSLTPARRIFIDRSN